MRIAIIGGGIGGLTLALALHEAGFDDFDVYESNTTVEELGVGVNLLPHAVRELDELGLLPELYQTGIPTAELSYLTQRGQLVWNEPRGIDAGYRWPQFSIHRGQLLGIIYRAACARIGRDRIHPGHHLQHFYDQHGEGNKVRCQFVDRASGAGVGETTADLVVACDGVHSLVRTTLYPNEGPPKWNGTAMWRGTTVAPPFLNGRSMFVAGRFVHRVVVYPISYEHEQRGEALVNWVCEKRIGEEQPMPRQDWAHQAEKAEVMRLFDEFRFPFLDIPALVANAEAVYQYPMVDRDPLPTWVHGRVTLLGDAAHPMYPVGSNGASQAIIDARTLAYELAIRNSIDEAVRAYDRIRRPLTAAVVEANRQVGPEKCIELAEERAPGGFGDITEVISEAELIDIANAYKQTAGFDPERLNRRASLSVNRESRELT